MHSGYCCQIISSGLMAADSRQTQSWALVYCSVHKNTSQHRLHARTPSCSDPGAAFLRQEVRGWVPDSAMSLWARTHFQGHRENQLKPACGETSLAQAELSCTPAISHHHLCLSMSTKTRPQPSTPAQAGLLPKDLTTCLTRSS